jgi:hypothetical protein
MVARRHRLTPEETAEIIKGLNLRLTERLEEREDLGGHTCLPPFP